MRCYANSAHSVEGEIECPDCLEKSIFPIPNSGVSEGLEGTLTSHQMLDGSLNHFVFDPRRGGLPKLKWGHIEFIGHEIFQDILLLSRPKGKGLMLCVPFAFPLPRPPAGCTVCGLLIIVSQTHPVVSSVLFRELLPLPVDLGRHQPNLKRQPCFSLTIQT